ncbi:phosphoribosylanthranilate isomerase [Chryseobacterium zhengzhouense]|uniref:N-(5'-phosphoribosyl)anthranilate isomerase n=1 Tax=Chryseobacterium zhengzhouense TaxID=1636086 RepID=A0ABW2M158_9FLAO
MAKIKVCGLTRLDQVQELISLKTDFLGFIFYEKSPRYVLDHLDLEEISEIRHHGKVGVFVNETAERIIEISEKADLNFIQLHGDESEDFIVELKQKINPKIKIIQVIRIGSQPPNELQKSINQNLSIINYFLFDTDSKAFGGIGKQFDWNILNTMEIPLPYLLSGGISEGNIENIKHLKQKPFALDINSRFETEPGNKDISKIKRFISSLT